MKITPRAAFRGLPASSVLLAILVWCHCVCSIAHARSHRLKTTSNGTEAVVDCELVRPFFDTKNITLAPAAESSPKSKCTAILIPLSVWREKKNPTLRCILIFCCVECTPSKRNHFCAPESRCRTVMSKSGDSDISVGRGRRESHREKGKRKKPAEGRSRSSKYSKLNKSENIVLIRI